MTTILAFIGMVAAPVQADTEKPPPGISAEAWRARPAAPVFSASASPILCFSGHVQGIGWTAWDCNDGDWAYAGTENQSLSLEAILIIAHSTGGRTCAQAHSKDIGWGAFPCEDDGREFAVGTTGQSRQMEAFRFRHTTRWSCNNAHGQNYGWQKEGCVGPDQYRMAGTTGQSLRLEAATATIL
ncbi:hypothetical protein SK854_34140 [Lentzea sp. BCCO 10_0061]|uniref:Uncharacterized protein n=1 Tax=Lentzea sokolovensis TaxID=3095429 RepID=A0ABU4V8B1_9PSEU|nr:hypothetical protein [Lentzea sp. BCCO 10_0061]MDX8147196.1 hypothetical protein [Lentzea sp. BCCO 10_0061]